MKKKQQRQCSLLLLMMIPSVLSVLSIEEVGCVDEERWDRVLYRRNIDLVDSGETLLNCGRYCGAGHIALVGESWMYGYDVSCRCTRGLKKKLMDRRFCIGRCMDGSPCGSYGTHSRHPKWSVYVITNDSVEIEMTEIRQTDYVTNLENMAESEYGLLEIESERDLLDLLGLRGIIVIIDTEI